MAHAAGCGSQRDIRRGNRERTLNEALYCTLCNVPAPGTESVSGGRRREGFSHMGTIMGTVLIVEDEVTTRDALTEVLGKEGREIITASDGQQALERLREVPRPRLILLDLMMPRMDGREFLRRQSADP